MVTAGSEISKKMSYKIVIKGGQKAAIKDIFNEIKEYKDLLYFLVVRDIKVSYKQTILGFLWVILQPLLFTLVFTFVFGRIAKVPSDGVPYVLFSFCGMVPWTYFSQSMNNASMALINNMHIISKIYFPRLIVIITPVLAKFLDFTISFIVLLIMLWVYERPLNLNLFFLPLWIVWLIMLSTGFSCWLSGLAIRYRDIKFILPFINQFLLYLAPVVWPVSLLEEKLSSDFYWVYGFYPMVGIIDGFRSSLLGMGEIRWEIILPGFVITAIIFISGFLFLRKTEKIIVDIG